VESSGGHRFVIALNPEEDTKLPYLLRLPLEGGVTLKTRETWPRSSRLYCHPFDAPWPEDAELVEEVPVTTCRRRGPSIDLVLDRPKLARSQFVFTEVRGRPAIFWQTQKAARGSSPGARIPRGRALDETPTIAVDTRERYPFRFAGKTVQTERQALGAGDYGVRVGGELLASVERKTVDNFAASLSDGTLAFQCQRLAEVPASAVVVEGRYADLFRLEHVSGAWLADMLVRLQQRYPEVQIVFADSRKFAEDWTYRFLASALSSRPVGADPA
jgi:hypothetical protein